MWVGYQISWDRMPALVFVSGLRRRALMSCGASSQKGGGGGRNQDTRPSSRVRETAGVTVPHPPCGLLGSWRVEAPAITKEFSLLCKAEVDTAKAAGEAV